MVTEKRQIVHLKGIKPIHYSKRTIEHFNAGDKAWISFDGKTAIPVIITGIDTNPPSYDFQFECAVKNPRFKEGDDFWLRLDEVGSTAELACKNCYA